MKKNTARTKIIGALIVFAAMFIVCIAPSEVLRMDSFVTKLFTGGVFSDSGVFSKADSTQPDKWYSGSELTIDEHFIFGEDRMYTEGKANRGFDNLIDNNSSTIFYVTTNDTQVNYQDMTGKEISITFHTNSPVVIDHFKIISGGDTYKANYAHRQPAAWNLKAGNSLDSCDNVLLENLPVKATVAYEENIYKIENTTAYRYYKFTITALAGAGRSGHDSPFSNPTATCLLADIAIGGPELGHASHDGITFEKWNSTNSLPNTAGDYYLTEDVTIGSTWNVPSGITNLCLNGHSITKTGNTGSAFYSGSGSTLNLYDCDTTTHYYDINGSTYLAENINTTSGTYSFVGGYITGGVGRSVNGGYRGGGVYVQGGTLNIYGGALVGNKASNGEGGGVIIDYGTVTMTGGYIVGNYASSDGGGLQVSRNNSGFFYMTGGHIDNNTANSHGGGITTYNVAEISGGTINGNQCFGGNRNYYKEGGGGIQTEAQGKLTVCGNVEISGNRSAMSGGGILVWGDCNYFKLSGSPVIKDNTASYGGSSYSSDNIRLNSNKKINIDGSLSNTAPIGVSLSSSSNNSTTTGEFTSGWKDYMTGKEPDDYFVSDNDNYVILPSGNEVMLSLPPVASITSGENTIYYSSISDALEGWKNGGKLTLLKDASYSSVINIRPMYGYNAGEYTLDLNGKTLNVQAIQVGLNNSPNTLRTGPHLTIEDSETGGILRFSESGMIDYGGLIVLRGGTLTGGNGTWGGLFLLHIYASLDMYDGVTLTGNTSTYGGAVLVGSDSEFNMYGGKISGNSASDSGGGVVIFDNDAARFNMYGGEISGNRAPKGGGVSVNVGSFHICGNNAIIKDNIKGGSWNSETATYTGGTPNNVYLPNGKKVIIESELSSVPIGVTLQNGSGVFTTGLSGNGTTANFTSDNADYEVRVENGEACLRYPDLPGVMAEGYEGNYDGTAHSITVTYPEGATVKFGTEEGDYTLDSCPTFTDAGTYTVYYQASKEKYTSVTGSATVTINKINATVKIVGNNNTSDYDGKEHKVTGYVATANTDLYDVTKDFTFSGDATAVRTQAGTTNMGLKAEQFANVNNNFATVTFEVTDGYQKINQINATVTIVGNNNTSDYDGKEHKVTGYVATANTNLYDVTKDFTFSGDSTVSRTNAGTVYMGLFANKFENVNANFDNVTFDVTDGYLTIEKINATVTIVGNNSTVDYDGTEHTVTGYVATADTALYDVTKDFTFSATDSVSRTLAGTTNMGLKVEQFTNTNSNFATVTFEVTDGFQKINQINATVTIVGNNNTVDYDGKEHKVEGYVATADTALYDVTKDFTFSGDATATRTEAGTTNMGLKAEQFANTNNNFATVTFEVADGYQKINQINATVTIVGNNNTVDYDGKEHKVEGYVATANTELYDVTKDFKFSGDATAVRTEAGTTNMGLKAEQFANTNKNFATVTFEITDGYQKINQINATVTIVGNNNTTDYDGKEHKVEGYVATTNIDLYDVTKDFTFSGDATAVRTEAGTTNMGLKAEQFANTNKNFATVTFEITDGYQKINQINATVKIVGNNNTSDYDGKEHKVTGYVATANTDLYDVTKDFTFSGDATATRTDAGTTNMGLKAEQFANTNKNFATVTFEITDDYKKINKIKSTVTIVGNKNTVDYDGKEHKVTGYVATANTELYDVTKDFTFSGDATAVRTDVGTATMNLSADQFANNNSSFKKVTFLVTDGYQTVVPVDAVITAQPGSRNLIYNGSSQQLVIAGGVDGGTMYYALGSDPQNAPADESYNVVVPSAKEVGIYYVWYKVEGDSNHNDLAPYCLKVVIAEEEWVGLSGTVYYSDGVTPLENVVVTLMQGDKKVDYVTTKTDGKYSFTVPTGIYNVVAERQNTSETIMVTVFENTTQNIVMSGSQTESLLKVNSNGDSSFGVAVGGLDKEADSIRNVENIPDNKSVSVVMTVELKTDETAKNASSFNSLSENKSFMFFDVTVEKTVDSRKTTLNTTTNVIEIAVPYKQINRHDLTVYYSDGTGVRTFTESSSKENGTYRIDKANGYIYIYTNRFSTFAIGYTPHYKLNSEVTLGAFKGKVSAVLTGQNGEGVYKLENVNVSGIRFADVPKGKYSMKLTWNDGATNTLTVPVKVSK